MRWPCSRTWRWTSSMSTSEYRGERSDGKEYRGERSDGKEYRSVDAESDLPVSAAELGALAAQLFASSVRPGPDTPPQTAPVAPRGNLPAASAAVPVGAASAYPPVP